MNILQIIPSYKPAFIYGGPVFSVSSLCENLAKEGHAVTVYTTTANGEKDLPIHENEPIMVDGVNVFYFHRVTKGNSNLPPRMLKMLWRDLRNYDIIHIHSWWNLVAIPAASICLYKGIKPILSLRGTLSDFTFKEYNFSAKSIFHRIIGRRILRNCFLHATTEKENKEVLKKVKISSSFILPNFINFASKTITDKKKDQVFTFVCLSRIHPVKNLEFVFSIVQKLKIDFELIIIGEGKAEYIQELKIKAKELNIEKKVKWVGQKGGMEKYQILENADLFLQLSLTENFGNAVIEAAGTGTPVLVSDTVGAAEVVRKLGLGWVIPLKEEEAITQLKKIVSLENELIQIRKKNPQKIADSFGEKPLTKKYLRFYSQFNLYPKAEIQV